MQCYMLTTEFMLIARSPAYKRSQFCRLDWIRLLSIYHNAKAYTKGKACTRCQPTKINKLTKQT